MSHEGQAVVQVTTGFPHLPARRGAQPDRQVSAGALKSADALIHHTAESPIGIRQKGCQRDDGPRLAAKGASETALPGSRWIVWGLRQLSGLDTPGEARRGAALAGLIALQAAGHVAGAYAAGNIARELANVKSILVASSSVAIVLLPHCFVALAGAFVKGVGCIGTAYYCSEITGRVAASVRSAASAHLMANGARSSETAMLATLSVRIRELEEGLAHGVIGRVRAIAQLVPLAVALILVSPLMAVSGAILIVPFGALLGRLRSRWRQASTDAQLRQEAAHEEVDELLRNLDLWRTYDSQSRMIGAIAQTGRHSARANALVAASRAALSSGNELLGTALVVAALLLVASAPLAISAGTALAFVTIVFMAYRPLRDLGDSSSWLIRGEIASWAVAEVVGGAASQAAAPDQAWTPASLRVSPPQHVEIRTTALYSGGHSLHVTLAPGTLTCLRGRTGCGKTTLLRELLGLQRGAATVRYGETEIPVTAGPSSRPFAWVPQDAPLITGTVLDNVMVVGANERRARECLAVVGALDLLERVGSDVVGPGGRPLSGGERRLVAVARALAVEAPILLIDEPTEGLDEAAAKRVLLALSALKKKRTLLVISHRDELTAIADYVLCCERAPGLAQN